MDQNEIKNTDILIWQGENEVIIKDYERALRFFQKAHQTDQKSVAALVNMGFCYAKLNKLALAEECFITALDQNPENTIAKRNLARIVHAQEKKEQKSSRPPHVDLKLLQRRLPDRETVFGRFIELAQESQKNGSIFSTIQYFEAASNIHPEFIDPYLQIAGCYEQLDELEKACAIYEQALSIYPEDETARAGKKRCCDKISNKKRNMHITDKKDYDNTGDADIDVIEIIYTNNDGEEDTRG
jgi:tetratricopeptide (TPR) repeat protein